MPPYEISHEVEMYKSIGRYADEDDLWSEARGWREAPAYAAAA